MTKQIFFILAVLCTLQAQASIQPVQVDTVQHTPYYNVSEELQPIQPVYLDGVVLPASLTGNWFVSIAGGTSAFLGTPLGCEDLFGRLKPSYSFAVGKWFTPSVGARINYSGVQFKDGTLSNQDYHHIHADLLWNVLGCRYARQEQVRWNLAPFAGVGLLHNASNGNNPFTVSYGVQGEYRISKRVSAMLELSGTTTFQDFDGYGRPNRLGDHMVSLTANILSGENKRYKDWYDRNRRTVAELKKILEIEGLLDKYGHLVNDDETDRRQGYPRNNYSGLNSLRARLKNRHWDGISPLDSASIGYGNNGDDAEKPGIIVSERTELIQAGNCIGSPVYFFFNLNTAHLTDASQMLNLDELARVAKKYGLSLRVTGAADSSTGTPVLNGSLSTSRADYIVAELKKRGIPIERIVKVSRGGIADHVPVEVNRHTKVELFF